MPRRRTLFAFALKMIRKPLHFVQRGRILLRCGSAFALSLPSLGVSSLDLGRLFIQAALFSCRVLRHRHSGARSEPQMRNCASGNPEIGLRDSGFSHCHEPPLRLPRNDIERGRATRYSAAAWNGPRSPSGTLASASASSAKSAATCANLSLRSRRRSSM